MLPCGEEMRFFLSWISTAPTVRILTVSGWRPTSLVCYGMVMKFAWASWKWFRFLLEAHAPKRIILIAHQDCGWYKSLPHHLFAFSDPRHRQEEDLRRARHALTKDFPDLSVELYYAGCDAQDRVTVESVST